MQRRAQPGAGYTVSAQEMTVLSHEEQGAWPPMKQRKVWWLCAGESVEFSGRGGSKRASWRRRRLDKGRSCLDSKQEHKRDSGRRKNAFAQGSS